MSYKSRYTLLIILDVDVQIQTVKIAVKASVLVQQCVIITSLCARDQQEHELVMSLTKIKETAPCLLWLHQAKSVMAVMLSLHTRHLASQIQLHSLEYHG